MWWTVRKWFVTTWALTTFLSVPTLIMTMWDSSRISRKLGFRTDKLMLGTAGRHKRRPDMMISHSQKNNSRSPSDGWVDRTLGVDMIFDVPLGAWSLLQIWTAGHLHLLPAPVQTQKPEFKLHVSRPTNEKWSQRLRLPFWQSLPGREQNTTSSFVPQANFAAQNLHRVASLPAAHLYLPQVVDVTRAILWNNQASHNVNTLFPGVNFFMTKWSQPKKNITVN